MNSDHRRTIRRGQLAFVLVAAIAVALAGTANAAQYVVSGGGGQLHIGGGLALPIQPAFTGTGTQLPNLLIPVNGPQGVTGTTAMSSQQKLIVPAGVLKKQAAQNTVGVFTSNPTLYAVATNLNYTWPTAAATFSTGVRPLTVSGGNTATYTGIAGGNAVYSNTLTKPFGGAARFAISGGGPAGVYDGTGVKGLAGVTIYAIAIPGSLPGQGNPPCTHTALTPVPFPGPGNPACVAGLAQALPTGLAAPGASIGAPAVQTPGGTANAIIGTTPMQRGPVPGVGIGKFGASGTVTFFALTPAGTMMGFTNMATSNGFPFTAGKIRVSAPAAFGDPEFFSLTGKDTRTAGGAGAIQMVAAAVSQRQLSGPNANRAWVNLELAPSGGLVPTMSEWARIATMGLMGLLAVGFLVVRRRATA